MSKKSCQVASCQYRFKLLTIRNGNLKLYLVEFSANELMNVSTYIFIRIFAWLQNDHYERCLCAWRGYHYQTLFIINCKASVALALPCLSISPFEYLPQLEVLRTVFSLFFNEHIFTHPQTRHPWVVVVTNIRIGSVK